MEKVPNGDATPVNFGTISGGQRKKLQGAAPSLTEGPLKLSGKNIEKCAQKTDFFRKPWQMA